MLKEKIKVDGNNKESSFSEEEMRAQIASLRESLLDKGFDDRLRDVIVSLNLIGVNRFHIRNLLESIGCFSLADEAGFAFLLKELGIIWDNNLEKKI